jgi:PTS system cellobiose-specific IIB component
MVIIKLFCQAGMSTSLLVHKMNLSAKERGIACFIKAYSANSLEREVPTADVVLLGPQLIYLQADARKYAAPTGIPVAIIRMQDYGMVNGEGVLDFALDLYHGRAVQ